MRAERRSDRPACTRQPTVTLKPVSPEASPPWLGRGAWGAFVGAVLVPLTVVANPLLVYSTGFEPPAFRTNAALVPQGGWIGDTAGADWIVDGFFEGSGQQALLGYWPPEGFPGSVSVWKSLSFDPVGAGLPVVTFKVSFAIYDCTATNLAFRDSFRWSVYNPTNRLFSLDFDNATQEIYYQLDDNQFVFADASFERVSPDTGSGLYDLAIVMNFAQNLWSATLNDVPLVDAKPITTKEAALTLGDIDAVWIANRDERFGDDYLIFDNYRIEADSAVPQVFRLEVLGRSPWVGCALRLHGEEGRRYALDASTGFSGWTALKTNTVTDGFFDFVDGGAATLGARFYRARAVAP